MVNELVVPQSLSSFEVYGDETIGKQIVTVSMSTVIIVGGHFSWQIRDSEIQVRTDLPPHSGVTGIPPRFIEPSVIPEVVGTWNSVKNPLPLTGLGIVPANIALHILH